MQEWTIQMNNKYRGRLRPGDRIYQFNMTHPDAIQLLN